MIPGSGRSPGEGNGNPHQYSCLENFMDGGGRWATVHGIMESHTTEQLRQTSLVGYQILEDVRFLFISSRIVASFNSQRPLGFQSCLPGESSPLQMGSATLLHIL